MRDLPLTPGSGCIVEYLQDNQPQLAMVVEEQGQRLRLFTQRNREMTMPAARLLPWIGPRQTLPASRAEMEECLARRLEARLQALADINILDIWNLAQGEMDSASLDWFAGLIWDHPNPDQYAALGRKLLETKTHFKFQPPLFQIYPEQTVAARLAEQEAAREHQELVLVGQDFFADLWKRGQARNPPGEIAAKKLASLLMRRISDPDDQDGEALWRNLTKTLPEHPYQALLLAQAWGLVPRHYNFWLDQVGYDWQDAWSASHGQSVDELLAMNHEMPASSKLSGLISVDSPTTRDIDDAFCMTRTRNDGFWLTMAIACPCLGWPWDSELDRAVSDRASSLYLPEGVSHMLPERLGIGALSLFAGQSRPALVLEMELNALAEVMSFSIRLARVEVQENTHYEMVEQAIDAGNEPFASAYALAALLRDKRIRQGAVVFDQPDPDLQLEGEGDQARIIRGSRKDFPRAHLLVSELMILSNSEAARWAIDQRLPLLYRTQNVVLPRGSAGHYTRPEDMYRMSRLLANATLRGSPEPHASLGVAAYASVSSPLRRYVDFLNMGQVADWLSRGRARLDREQVESGLPQWRARLEAVGRIQRNRTRYWKLEYLRQQGRDHSWPAVLVDETPHQAVFSLPEEQILIRAPKRLVSDKCLIGGAYRLRLAKVDPLLNEIKVLEAHDDHTDKKE